MDPFQGKLVKDGQTVADGISGRLGIDYKPDRSQRWEGFFSLPSGSTAVSVGDQLELVLTDGRAAKIKIGRFNHAGQSMSASFEST